MLVTEKKRNQRIKYLATRESLRGTLVSANSLLERDETTNFPSKLLNF